MSTKIYPYIIFLPKDSKHEVLRAIFGSFVPIDILKFALHKGIHEKIYQKDLIENLSYSNKTIIEHLKSLTDLGILDEHMEKVEFSGRTLWLKVYTLTDLGKWFALLLAEENSLSRDDKISIVFSVFRLYVRWLRDLINKLGVKKEEMLKIFEEEIG